MFSLGLILVAIAGAETVGAGLRSQFHWVHRSRAAFRAVGSVEDRQQRSRGVGGFRGLRQGQPEFDTGATGIPCRKNLIGGGVFVGMSY